MPRFGTRSTERLLSMHSLLQSVSVEAIKHWDFTILHGYRGEDIQNELYAQGLSQKRYPESKHNRTSEEGEPESWAVDFAPWFPDEPHVRWDQERDFVLLAGKIMGIAEPILKPRGFTLRYGGDWNMNQDTTDQTFMDLGHLELVLLT